MTRDLRTLIEPRTPRRMFENIVLESASWCMQSGSSSRSERNRGAAVEADEIGEQQPKWTQSRSSSWKRTQTGSSSAAEVDAIGEQQLCTESCPAPDYSEAQ